MDFDYLKSVPICSYLQTKTNTGVPSVSPFEKRPECPVYLSQPIIPAPLLPLLNVLIQHPPIAQFTLLLTLPCPPSLVSKAQLLSLKRGKNSPNGMKSVISSTGFHILTFNNRLFERKSNQNLPENGLYPLPTIGPNAVVEANLRLPRELSLLSNPTRH